MTEQEMIKTLQEHGFTVVPASRLEDARRARVGLQQPLTHATKALTKMRRVATQNALDVVRLRKLLEKVHQELWAYPALAMLVIEIDEVLDATDHPRADCNVAVARRFIGASEGP
jgi:hypothetical protein